MSVDDETCLRLHIRAAEQNTSFSQLVKTLLEPTLQRNLAMAPSPAPLELAAELRALTASRAKSPAKLLQREGRDER